MAFAPATSYGLCSAIAAKEGKKSRSKEPCGENNESGLCWWHKVQHRVRQEQRNPYVMLSFFYLLLGFSVPQAFEERYR